jgi:CheY-like chemotaxis protein
MAQIRQHAYTVMTQTVEGTAVCPYCGRPLRWVAGRWFGRGCFECESCGEFPDLRTLPPPPRGADRPAERRKIPVRRDERPRVLLVDDSIEQCDLYALMLEPTASVITASRGEEAIAIARAEQLDAIVLDVMMPGMDGWEVCKRLKANAPTAHIPVIMLTSLDGVEVAAPGHRLGAAAVLMKPCPAERLAVAINAAVNAPVKPQVFRTPRRWSRKPVGTVIPFYVNEAPARILDVSYGGVRVEIDSASDDIPASFDMSVPATDVAVRVEVVWKARREVGHWTCGARVTASTAEWRGLVDAIA